MKEVQINLFKINIDAFMDTLFKHNNKRKIYYYKYKSYKYENEDKNNFYKLKHYGNVEDENEKIISTIFPLNKDELEFIKEEDLNKSKITENHIKGYLRYRYNLSGKLSSKFKEILIENYVLSPHVRFDILRENENFYITLTFKYRIHLGKSMLEAGLESLKKDDKFIFIF